MFAAPIINTLALAISCVLCLASLVIAIGFAAAGLSDEDFEELRTSLVLILITIVMGFFFASACVNESQFRKITQTQVIEQTSQAAE